MWRRLVSFRSFVGHKNRLGLNWMHLIENVIRLPFSKSASLLSKDAIAHRRSEMCQALPPPYESCSRRRKPSIPGFEGKRIFVANRRQGTAHRFSPHHHYYIPITSLDHSWNHIPKEVSWISDIQSGYDVLYQNPFHTRLYTKFVVTNSVIYLKLLLGETMSPFWRHQFPRHTIGRRASHKGVYREPFRGLLIRPVIFAHSVAYPDEHRKHRRLLVGNIFLCS